MDCIGPPAGFQQLSSPVIMARYMLRCSRMTSLLS
jgi:hypothetical protein